MNYLCILFFLFSFMNTRCDHRIKRTPDKTDGVKCLKLSCIAPVGLENGINKYDTFVNMVFFYGDFYIYTNEIMNFQMTDTGDKDFENNISREKKHQQYIVVYGKDSVGFLYDSLESHFPTKIINVDSFFSNYFVLNFRNYYKRRIEMGVDSLFAHLQKESDDTYTEKFFTKLPSAEDRNDTSVYYYSSKYNEYDFSFVPMLDSLYKMKLYKIRYLFNEVFSPRLSMTLPARELMLFMEIVDAAYPKEIIALCRKFNKGH